MVLEYSQLKPNEKFPTLDFTDDDKTDPMEINHFFHKEKFNYQNNNLARVWIVRNNNVPLAYFTTSMNAIEVKLLAQSEQVIDATTKRYPSMLLGRMGVDKKYRKKGIALKICKFCRGLAEVTGDRIACRYVVLETKIDRQKVYKSAGFVLSEKPPKNGKVWMYRRII